MVPSSTALLSVCYLANYGLYINLKMDVERLQCGIRICRSSTYLYIHLRNPPFINPIFNYIMRTKRDSAGSKEK